MFNTNYKLSVQMQNFESYHPETNLSKCFLVELNYTLLVIIKEKVDAIYERKKIKIF